MPCCPPSSSHSGRQTSGVWASCFAYYLVPRQPELLGGWGRTEADHPPRRPVDSTHQSLVYKILMIHLRSFKNCFLLFTSILFRCQQQAFFFFVCLFCFVLFFDKMLHDPKFGGKLHIIFISQRVLQAISMQISVSKALINPAT